MSFIRCMSKRKTVVKRRATMPHTDISQNSLRLVGSPRTYISISSPMAGRVLRFPAAVQGVFPIMHRIPYTWTQNILMELLQLLVPSKHCVGFQLSRATFSVNKKQKQSEKPQTNPPKLYLLCDNRRSVVRRNTVQYCSLPCSLSVCVHW